MGFNNGYEAGFADCEALNRTKWERQAVERAIADMGQSQPAPSSPSPSAPLNPVIAQTSDGKCRITSFRDPRFRMSGDHAPWKIEGIGLYGADAPEGEWRITDVGAVVDGTDVGLTLDYSGDGTCATVVASGEAVPGTYENVEVACTVARGGTTETLTLTIPQLTVEYYA